MNKRPFICIEEEFVPFVNHRPRFEALSELREVSAPQLVAARKVTQGSLIDQITKNWRGLLFSLKKSGPSW
jgi:hypothetical protein